LSQLFTDCAWVWYPEGNPAQSAPPGTRYFRKVATVPAERKITKALFAGTADNSFTLFINGQEAGRSDASSEGWRRPVQLDVTRFVRSGPNQVAVSAFNATEKASPAGLLGCLRVEFSSGEPLVLRVDKTWKAQREASSSWATINFDDSAWPAAREVVGFGNSPWGMLGGGQLTLSPVKADPFYGRVTLLPSLNLKTSRVYLEMDDIAPELASRVTVNEVYAGGFLGKPLRLDVGRFLKPGENSIRLEPFAPQNPRLVVLSQP
jgi:hypothetical protein